jgi:OHCU decarboxylase
MNEILHAWNEIPEPQAFDALLSCCAARKWANRLTALRPFANEESLFGAADNVWESMRESDWMEAFRAHPRIGERKAVQASAQSSEWSKEEQASVGNAQIDILAELAAGNRRYEELFGFTYIVCATGKSAEDMLSILQRRLANGRDSELKEAAEQQRQILQIRLRRWLHP